MEERELAIYSGAKIKELRKSKKMTQQELGDKIGVSNSAVANYEKGFRAPLQDTLFKLAEVFDVSVNDFFPQTTSTKDIESIYKQLTPPRKTRVYNFAEHQLREQNNKVVPLVGSTAANPQALEYADAINDISINTDVPNSADCALVVRGNSMEPDYMDGSIVFYKRQEMVENRDLAIVEIDGDGVTFKKVIFDYDNQQLILRSLNPEYPDRILKDNEYRIIGKVVK